MVELIRIDCGSCTAYGATIENNPQNRPQDPGTLDNIFVPVSVVIENTRGIWWIDDPEGIREIEQHLRSCIAETQHSLSKLATEFRDKCFEHAHVLHRLEELFQI